MQGGREVQNTIGKFHLSYLLVGAVLPSELVNTTSHSHPFSILDTQKQLFSAASSQNKAHLKFVRNIHALSFPTPQLWQLFPPRTKWMNASH
jgi:hypothetical protein